MNSNSGDSLVWRNSFLGVLLFGIGNAALDLWFSQNAYGFFFYPSFLALLFLLFSRWSTPERSMETLLGVFNIFLLQVYLKTFFVSSTSYFLWGLLFLGTLTLLLVGRFCLSWYVPKLLWHYYLGISCAVTALHYSSFFQKSFSAVFAFGSFLVVLGLGFLSRYRLIPVICLMLCSLWSTFTAVPFLRGAEGKPNLLLITIDTLRKDALSCYGSKNPTPALDALAKQGVLYEQAYSTAPWTLPSIASLLTGLYPGALGLGIETDPNALPPLTHEAEPLALLLHRAGYRTLGMVSNFWLTNTRKLDIGFDTYKNFSDEYSPAIEDPQPFFLRLVYWMFEPQTFSSGSFLLDESYQRLKKGEGAFFLWVHLIEPHLPYNNQVKASEFKGSKGNLEKFSSIKMDQGSLKKGVWKLTPEARQFFRWWYDQEVREVDALIGQFLERLQKEGYLDNTLIVVASDHGEEFWDHGSVVHGHTLYNELIQVPLLFHYPKKLVPARVSTKVSHAQVYPTILKLLDVPQAKKSEWRVPSLEKTLPYLFAESILYFEDRKALVLQEGWKWIHFYGQTSEIYNLTQDPKEQNPLKIAISDEWQKIYESWRKENQSINEILEKGRNQIHISEEERQRLRSLGYN